MTTNPITSLSHDESPVGILSEALTRMRDNPFWTCQCNSREECESDEPWDRSAVWPEPATHDIRCPVFISADALNRAAIRAAEPGED